MSNDEAGRQAIAGGPLRPGEKRPSRLEATLDPDLVRIHVGPHRTLLPLLDGLGDELI